MASTLPLLRLIKELAKEPEGSSLARLNTVLGGSKSTLQYRLRLLVAGGFVLHNRLVYRLGPPAFRFASAIMAASTFGTSFRPCIQELMNRSGESVYIGVLDQDCRAITYADASYCPQWLRHSIPVGAAVPLHFTAAGRLLLAYTDKDFQEDYLRSSIFKERSNYTPTDPTALRRTLVKIRDKAFSSSVDEGAAELSVPIVSADGRVTAALIIAGPAIRITHDLLKLRRMLEDVAARASAFRHPAARVGSLHRRESRRI